MVVQIPAPNEPTIPREVRKGRPRTGRIENSLAYLGRELLTDRAVFQQQGYVDDSVGGD